MKNLTKNRSDKCIIRDFTESTTDLKIRVINPGLHIMEHKAPPVSKNTTETMDIKFQLAPPINHIANNIER